MGAHGFWIGIIIGLTVAAVLLAAMLKQQLSRLEKNYAAQALSTQAAD